MMLQTVNYGLDGNRGHIAWLIMLIMVMKRFDDHTEYSPVITQTRTATEAASGHCRHNEVNMPTHVLFYYGIHLSSSCNKHCIVSKRYSRISKDNNLSKLMKFGRYPIIYDMGAELEERSNYALNSEDSYIYIWIRMKINWLHDLANCWTGRAVGSRNSPCHLIFYSHVTGAICNQTV